MLLSTGGVHTLAVSAGADLCDVWQDVVQIF